MARWGEVIEGHTLVMQSLCAAYTAKYTAHLLHTGVHITQYTAKYTAHLLHTGTHITQLNPQSEYSQHMSQCPFTSLTAIRDLCCFAVHLVLTEKHGLAGWCHCINVTSRLCNKTVRKKYCLLIKLGGPQISRKAPVLSGRKLTSSVTSHKVRSLRHDCH